MTRGILASNYNEGILAGSRLVWHEELQEKLAQKIERIKALRDLSRMNCALIQSAIAWCLKNFHNLSSVIVGVTSIEQLQDKGHTIKVKLRLVEEIMKNIDAILQGNQKMFRGETL